MLLFRCLFFRVLPMAGLLLATAPGAKGDSPRKIEAPHLEFSETNHLVLARLPPILGLEGVSRHLTTGLTTTFIFRLEARASSGRQIQTGARVEIRYELWDEVFHTLVVTLDGVLAEKKVASLDELGAWWDTLQLPLTNMTTKSAAGATRGRLVLEVVPFSEAERDDTERWLYDSARRAQSGGADGSSGGARGSEIGSGGAERSLEHVFTVLIATSLRRRAVISYRWTVELPGKEDRP